MKSKTLVFATLLIFTAAVLIPAISQQTALADGTWTDTGGAVSSYNIDSLAYDSTHSALYAGTYEDGVWKFDGTTWTNTGGAISSYSINSLAYDSGHNLLYAGTEGHGVWKFDGTTWTDPYFGKKHPADIDVPKEVGQTPAMSSFSLSSLQL